MKILVILASGIGNSILFSPAMLSLRKAFPEARIDIFAYKKSFAEPFSGSGIIDNVFCHKGPGTILKLRKQKYDISVTAFPSNKWQFNLFAFLAGAKKRITHSYSVGRLSTLSFLQNCRVPADKKLHDVEQNFNLLGPMGVGIPKNKKLFFHIGAENRKYAEDFIKKNSISGKSIIGIHPGSGPLSGKKAPPEAFISKIAAVGAEKKAVLIFGGPEESELKNEIHNSIADSLIVGTSLKNAAALIGKCSHFITNDTGLMHIAAAMEKPKITAFFNGTNPSRTAPYSANSEVVLLRKNSLKYPFYSTRSKL